MNLSWRLYTLELHEVVLGRMRAFAVEGGFAFEEKRSSANLRYLHDHPEYGATWLVEADGLPAGYAVVTLGFSFEFGGHDSFVDEIYIDPGYRGRGVGKATLRFLETAAREMGARWLHLEAADQDRKLKEFYDRCGFAVRAYRLHSKPLG